MGVYRYCGNCGTQFEAKGEWMKLCWKCWREREDAKRVEASNAASNDAYEDGYDIGYNRGYDQGFREGRTNGFQDGLREGKGRAPIDPDLLRQMIQLCHPDRHPPERSPLANRVTADLLGMLRAN